MSKKKALGLAALTAALAAAAAKVRGRFRAGGSEAAEVPGAVPVTETIQDDVPAAGDPAAS